MMSPKRMDSIKTLIGSMKRKGKGSTICHCDAARIALIDLVAEIEECDKRHAQIPIVNSPDWVSGLCERAMKMIDRARSSIPVFAYQIMAEEAGELSRYIAGRQSEGRIAGPISCEKRCLGCLDVKFPHNPDCPEG